jgi:uncharacterized membrane protein YgdD (TMEM256/DUF423 family)
MKSKIVIIAVLGFLAVALGAFGAHGLKKMPIDAASLHAYETGVQYQFYHLLAMAFVLCISDKIAVKRFNSIFNFFLLGIVLFSGSLYGIAFGQATGMPLDWLGPVTPIGGLSLLAAWGMLAYTFYRNKDLSSIK